MIEVDKLSKVYPGSRKRGPGRREAVLDVTFQCQPGEIYALLGPNGAGKTTTLRMIATSLAPTSGTARICGHDLLQEPTEVRRSIGFLTGNTDLYGRLKAKEILNYFGQLYGLKASVRRDRIELLADLFGMGDFLDRRCDKLSSGMKQKVSIARSVIHDPPVIVLDEPTATLDVITSRAIVEFILESRVQRKSVLLSTHVMPEAQKLADRVGILHEGRLFREGTPARLLQETGCADLEDAFLKIVADFVPDPVA